MKTLSIKLMMTALLAITVNANAQIRNAKTELITVYGNCGMCENTIESAGNLKKIAKVDWDKDSKIATITYDSAKTDKNEILKRIALAGYDSDSFLAPDDVYNNLHGCCQYDRTAKIATTNTESKPDHSNHAQTTDMTAVKQTELQLIYANYFALKDALVSSNSGLATTKASALSASINKLEMDKLDMDVHMVWMKVVENIKADSKSISVTKDLEKQRKIFANLSNEIYSLMKVAKFDNAVFYQYCPMASGGKGANWLSKENEVRNPYYGSAMMTCGKTVETIK